MSIQLLRQGIRLRADARSRQPLLDFHTNATPQGWVKAATQFEVALASGGALVDVANLASVTVEAAPCADRDGARVFSKTLAGSALDPGLTEDTWADGSRQHALFILSSGEMNVALPSGADRTDFWLVITALTTAGDPLVCGTARFVLADDGTFSGAPPPPANPGVGITIDQADARYAPAGAVGGIFRLRSRTTGSVCPVVLDGPDNAPAIVVLPPGSATPAVTYQVDTAGQILLLNRTTGTFLPIALDGPDNAPALIVLPASA